MLCFLHSKNIILNRIFFSLSKGLRFSSKAKTFLVSNSKSCCSTFKGKRKTKQQKPNTTAWSFSLRSMVPFQLTHEAGCGTAISEFSACRPCLPSRGCF